MQSDNLKVLANVSQPEPGLPPKHTTISDAARHLLAQPVPGDKLGRTYAEMIASALIARAVGGDVRALKLVFEIVEPGDAETRQTQKKRAREVVLKVVYGDRPRHAVESEQGKY